MISLRIANATRVLAESQDEYNSLAIYDEVVDGANQMTSLWEPTPAELKMLMAGGSVRLSILGTIHPPVALTVQPAPSEI
jgi:hypothetical protein